MPTLERSDDAYEYNMPEPRRRRPLVALAAAVAVALVTGGVAYAVGSSNTKTKTVVQTVAAPTPTIADRGFSKLDNGFQATKAEFYSPMSAATHAQLEHQLMLAREAALQYPTVAAAEAAGYRRQGPFSPGLGAHYINSENIATSLTGVLVMSDYEALHPALLIYDGTHPNSPIVGLMYMALRYPQGFAGLNDIWHYHTNICIVKGAGGVTNAPLGADTTVTKAQCDAVHGVLDPKSPWMLHAWVVPGYDSSEGVFSHDNPAITCDDGTYHIVPLSELPTHLTSACIDGTE